MINLIPNREKKEMIKGFYYGLVILFLLVLGFSVFILLISILPSYFISSTKSKFTNAKLESQKNEPVPSPDQQTIAVIKDLNDRMDLVENAENKKFDISQKAIKAIILQKISAIKIINISYENDPKKGKKISIQGIAPSREVLLSFRLALENDSSFKQVNLPISNFIKGSNIQFYLSLIPS